MSDRDSSSVLGEKGRGAEEPWPGAVRLEIRDGTIELGGYGARSTLWDLAVGVERIRTAPELETSRCHGCGRCCREPIPVLGLDIGRMAGRLGLSPDQIKARYLRFPESPDPVARRRDIESLKRQMDLSMMEATLIYEHNRAEPVTTKRDERGRCIFLEDNLCSIYEDRPYICRLYTCNMGERLSILYEQVENQGVWHSYVALGWLEAKEVVHNPFLGAEDYRSIPLSQFDVPLEGAMEKVFFFF